MEHEIASGHSPGKGGQVQNIAPNDVKAGALPGPLEVFQKTGRKIVVAGDCEALFEQRVRQIASDESSRACYKKPTKFTIFHVEIPKASSAETVSDLKTVPLPLGIRFTGFLRW
jgi:hypothetical protein